MPIVYHETSRTFHLYNDQISYLIKLLQNNQLGQLYFGKRLRDRESYDHLLEVRARSMAACTYEGNLEFSLEHLKQEYPAYGTGDMRYPAYGITLENGSRITSFTYVSHTVSAGKPALDGLPATYTEEDGEAQTLEVTLTDVVTQTDLVLSYSIFEEVPAIARSARFIQHGETPVTLDRAMSLCVDLPDYRYEMVELTGAWCRERMVKNRRLEHGIQAVYSMRGCSSSNYNPFLALKRPETGEASGEVYGFSLVYSGNFLAQAEVDTYGVTRVTMGIHPEGFRWQLAAGEQFQTPEAVMVYAENGLNEMSLAFHNLYRSRLARGYWRDRTRPILVNNWEATYFRFDEKKIVSLARTAKDLGLELLVLDDGWFGRRDDDTTSLGDWYPDTRKLPGGIARLAKKVVETGLQFGLWFEPEMVNKDSDLYRAHPEWMLATPGRNACHGRNQYVLDFSKEEVVDHIFTMMDKVLSEAPVSYIKWDMNRCITEAFSSGMPADYQGRLMHRYILGVYRLYDKLIRKFPHILFESCASGGARFDPGMLYYAPQCWTSDDTDAVERLKIQYGTSYVYPISSMGSHVSAVPNHQVHRVTPMDTRADVAYFGTFGYELDLNALTEQEKNAVKKQVAFMKKHRELLQFGDFYRLKSPFEGDGNETAWMVVSKDRRSAIVGYYRVLQQINVGFRRVRLQGLDPALCYDVSVNGMEQYGDELMQHGLITSDRSSGGSSSEYMGADGDYQSRLYFLNAR